MYGSLHWNERVAKLLIKLTWKISCSSCNNMPKNNVNPQRKSNISIPVEHLMWHSHHCEIIHLHILLNKSRICIDSCGSVTEHNAVNAFPNAVPGDRICADDARTTSIGPWLYASCPIFPICIIAQHVAVYNVLVYRNGLGNDPFWYFENTPRV